MTPSRTPRLHVVTENSTSWLREEGTAVALAVYAVPQATRTRVMGIFDGLLKVQLRALPEDGQANDALVRFVADALCVARAQVTLMTGHSSRRKRLRIEGASYQAALLALSPSAP